MATAGSTMPTQPVEIAPPRSPARVEAVGKSEPGASPAQPEEVAAAIRVIFEEDGTPAANVGVYLRSLTRGALGVETRTDEEGRVRFEGLAHGGYTLDLDRWDRGPTTLSLTRGWTNDESAEER